MDIRTQSALLASLVGLALGLAMLLRPGRPRVVTLYSLFALTVAGYYLSLFIHGVFPQPTYPWVTRVAVGATILVASVVPGTAVAFFLEFLGVSKGTHLLGRRELTDDVSVRQTRRTLHDYVARHHPELLG